VDVYIAGKRFRLDPSSSIGKGGEADVFKINAATAAKIFKRPDHPDLQGQPEEQAGAREKLRQFPKGLPQRVVCPEDLISDHSGKALIGYTMPLVNNAEVLLRYADVSWRQSSGIKPAQVVAVFRDLAATVGQIHAASAVIGDFNDLNVLVRDTQAHVIDADSFQFGPFPCRVFTARFVDPLLCDPKRSSPMLARPYVPDSDWYAYNVMLMQCLLYAGPYGGVYRPKSAANRVDHEARPLKRITVFNPEVKRPKVMIDPDTLPDDLLQYWHQLFERDKRGPFPLHLLHQLEWKTCQVCGTEFARAVCPSCRAAAPAAIREVTRIRGTVTATRVFHTSGVILFATVQGGKLRWLFHANDAFRREDDAIVINGALDPQMRFRIKGPATIIGKSGKLATMDPGEAPDITAVDNYGQLPVFDANDDETFYVSNGQLQRTDTLGPKHLGDVLQGQTLFWVGPTFGFGFYRAGLMHVSFVFDARARGINDNVHVPSLNGQLVDATCVFSKEYCWFLVSTQAGGTTINQCFVINRQGTVVATAQAVEGDGTWLGKVRGACATGDSLFTATDDGIVRVRPDNGTVAVTQSFPDTEPFVSSSVHLHAASNGLYAVDKQDIVLLQIK
jgi:hypothetical protein